MGRFINADEAEFAILQENSIGHNLFGYCGNDGVNSIDPFGFYKVSLRVRAPKKGSTVAWAFKDGNFDVGHVFLALDPENGKKVIYRGFGMNTKSPVIYTLLRLKTNGLIYDEKLYYKYDSQKTYVINKRQYDSIRNALYPSKTPQYHIVSYNCATFALDVLSKAGIKHNFKKRFWNLGVVGYAAIASISFLVRQETTRANLTRIEPYTFKLIRSITSKAITAYLYSFAFSRGYYPGGLTRDIAA